MKLYRLGAVRWDESQALYHALAQTGQEALVICRPVSRCVCLGLHDDLEQEIDTAYCRLRRIPLIRREIGGGVVLLDPGQLFFQLILHAGNPLLTGRRDGFFRKFLDPVIRTLRDFSIPAALKSPADIVVDGKKISGNGAGDIDGCAVFTGNILLSFDRTAMANVLNLPGERFREMTRVSMERYLTTLEEELAAPPDVHSVEERLASRFSDWLPGLQPAGYDAVLRAAVNKAAAALTNPEFLSLPGKRGRVRQIKINEGCYLRFHPFPGCRQAGCVRQEVCALKTANSAKSFAILLIRDGKIRDMEHSGPPCLKQGGESLAAHLSGVGWQEKDLRPVLSAWRRSGSGRQCLPDSNTLLHWLLYEQNQ